MIVLDDLVLEWYTIEQGSVCIGQSIRDLQVRTESGASIVSIIAPNRINRINPEADTILNEGATLIFIGGSIYIVLNFVVGVAYAYLTGFAPKEMLIVAGITTISSSAIVAKILFDYRRTANPETELILGITMYEDVFLAVYRRGFSVVGWCDHRRAVGGQSCGTSGGDVFQRWSNSARTR